MAGAQQTVRVDGHSIRLSNLDKVLYPATGTTKGEVIGYVSSIAETMLTHCRDRAATRKRWPDGVGEEGDAQSFFQKDIGGDAPDWIETGRIAHRDHTNAYPLVNSEATLVWLAQLAALEIHVPQWRFDRSGKGSGGDGEADPRLGPDRMVLDLDPGPGVDLRQCARVAGRVRDILEGMGLESVPVTSGSKGIHLYAALDGRQTSEQVSQVAKELARSLEADHPDEIISAMKRELRAGKVFIDWSQNNGNKTTIAPYSLRGRARPTVAAPRTWRELASPHLKQLLFTEALDRVESRGDPLAELGRAADAYRTSERLELYREKRDASRTPEPVPGPGGGAASASGTAAEPGASHVFVIQRHQARRLHYDFRLEHDGVLVSWALPKGVPTDPKRNHLAVPTEDHPMEYGHFEGTIPKGEYGAGEVEIWDSGTYELEKWRGDEIIVTLTGEREGGLGEPRRLVLFRTQADPPQWMIHLMDREPRAAREKRASTRSARGAGSARRGPVPKATPGDDASGSGVSLKPMLATRAPAAEIDRLDAGEWAFEMKWDGMRLLMSIAAGTGGDTGDAGGAANEDPLTRLTSRSLRDVTSTFPELLDIGPALGVESAVLDGEVVALGANDAPSFERLQQRMGLSDPREVRRAQQSVGVQYLAFDLLELNGNDCRALPYAQRRELLLALAADAELERVFAVPAAFEGGASDGESDADSGNAASDAVAAARQLHLEGIVAKRVSSPYRSGRRSADWLKLPLFETAEVVVIGWRDSDADPGGFASLLLAAPAATGSAAAAPAAAKSSASKPAARAGLVYSGRVASGFRSVERARIRAELARSERKTPPVEVPSDALREAHWVTPRRVGEVTFRERTSEGRLRHAVWRGWRPDRDVSEFLA
ncbi:non-homologous end-joining DNA ligase [Leucobacter sp. USHLN153]|uniref:non-homologous end-joining DNA ligase n=1 Tax=Leucobacter sp. USHLN153 TaxID=3081268 RepID=UPI0030190819